MFNRKSLWTLCAVVAVGLLAVASTHVSAGAAPRINYLTFSQPVALPGVVLPAGTYAFEEAPGGAHRDVVLVTDRGGQTPFYLGFTMPVRRPESLPDDQPMEFGEAPAGSPIPIAVWYPVGSSTGHEFLYR